MVRLALHQLHNFHCSVTQCSPCASSVHLSAGTAVLIARRGEDRKERAQEGIDPQGVDSGIEAAEF